MTRRFLGGAVLGVLLLPACTAVLGMDKAKFDEGVGAAASGGGAGAGSGGAGGSAGGGAGTGGTGTFYPRPVCDTPDPACQACVSGCSGNCLNTTGCRIAINKHMNCLDASCQDPGSCATQHFGAFPEMTDCLKNACDDACSGVETVASTCELYCKCMEQNCAGAIPAATCLQQCAGIEDLKNVYCRWQHCERASPDAPQHCEHAQGKLGFCPLSTPSGGRPCPDRIHTGLTCDSNAECCSYKCQGNVCID